jgi:succinate dehydrogenase / fumarate reductase flavoprotein subunit
MAKKEQSTAVEATKIDARIPQGALAEKWSNYKAHQKLVNPSNKRRLDVIVVEQV